MYYTLGQHKEAREQLELALQRQLLATGRNHPDTGILYKDLAYEEYLTRRNPEAWGHAREALAILKRAGRQLDRQEIIESLDVLAIALYASGRPLPEAEVPLREALTRSRASVGDGGATPALIGTLSTFAVLQGKFDDAVHLAKESLALYRARPGPMTVECFTPLRNLGAVCLERLDYKCAENCFRSGLETTEKNLGADSLFNMNLRAYYALAIGLSGRGPEAERELNVYVERTRAAGGSTELYIAMAEEFLGRVQMAEGKLDVAEANLRKAIATYRQYRSKDDIRNTVVLGRLGECLLQKKQRSEAVPLLTASYQSILGAFGPDHPWTVQARERLTHAQ